MPSDEMVETAFIAFVGADMSKVCTNHPTRYRLRAALTAVYPAIRAEALMAALRECADDLAAEIDARYPADVRAYPSMEAKYQRDMEPVLRARAALAKWETNDG